MVEKYMKPNIPIAPGDSREYMNACQIAAKQFLLSNPKTSLDVLRRPPVGNPYGYMLDGTMIYVCAEYHYHYSSIIKKLLKQHQSPVVFELGGGFGGMAYYLMRDTSNITYIAADLPENAALQAYYLISNFPTKRIALYGEFDLDNLNPNDYDAIIIPNFAIDSLKNNVANLSFNSYSLAEMDIASVTNYISKICDFTSDYFYHLNHAFWSVSADDFPVNFEKFDLLLRYPVMWGRNPHDCTLDHHEYIYSRK
jgi:putative sugar O-methyltransferase